MRFLIIGDFQGEIPSLLKKKLKKENFDAIIGVGDYGGIEAWRPYIFEIFRCIKKGKERPTPDSFFGKKGFKRLLEKDFVATRRVLEYLDSFDKPVLSVFGNSDDSWYTYPFDSKRSKVGKREKRVIKKLKNFVFLDYKKKSFRGRDFIGFGGFMDIDSFIQDKEFKKLGRKTVARVKRRMRLSRTKIMGLFKNTREAILVLHYPPKGIFDIIRDRKNPMDGKSAGVRSFAEAIKKHKPNFVLCGHMHEYYGVKKLHGVPIINPGDAGKGKYAILETDDNFKLKKVRFVR